MILNGLTDLILNKWFLIGLTLLSCYLLNAELPLFSLKMKTYGFKEKCTTYVFLYVYTIVVVLQLCRNTINYYCYILLSVVINSKK